MPRMNDLDNYIGHQVQGTRMVGGGRMEGELQAVRHLDDDDYLIISGEQVRLGKLTKLVDLSGTEPVQIWPAGVLVIDVEVSETPDQDTYDKAVTLLGKSVIVTLGGERLRGTLDAVSPKNAVEGAVLLLGRGEGEATVRIIVGAVEDVKEDTGQLDETPAVTEAVEKLTPEELETAILPSAEKYPFTGKAPRKVRNAPDLDISFLAAKVARVAAEYGESTILTLANAAQYYGLDPVQTQAVQALIAQLEGEE